MLIYFICPYIFSVAGLTSLCSTALRAARFSPLGDTENPKEIVIDKVE